MPESVVGYGTETAGTTAISPVHSPGDHAACDAEIARLRAEITALRNALKRHVNWFTDKDGVRLCGGCLRRSPCPDAGLAEGTGQDRGEGKGPSDA